jgi:prolyl oligopeptidase
VQRRADIPLDGTTPTLLDAYGGFEIPMLPYYSGAVGAAWLENGGIKVMANIRGGGVRVCVCVCVFVCV